jgi:hypothetical protein
LRKGWWKTRISDDGENKVDELELSWAEDVVWPLLLLLLSVDTINDVADELVELVRSPRLDVPAEFAAVAPRLLKLDV